ncbi:MAG: ferritin-like domain-containing protein [Candidatus Hodarchaeales archaeon]|jgi:ferritin-like protein
MDKIKRVEFFKKQITLEEKIVESANTSIEDVTNVMVKELILGIAMDSNKHASLLNALVALNTGTTPLIPEEITDQLKKNVEKHIELEQHAIDTYKELWEELEDEKEKIVIKSILNDEIRHHQLLKRIHSMIVEKETLTEQDIWDWTWKDSLFHGSPGG